VWGEFWYSPRTFTIAYFSYLCYSKYIIEEQMMTMQTSGDTVVKERVISKLKEPGLYKVVFLNDNVTPMDFVVQVLKDIYHHSEAQANAIMKEVHNNGSGVAGVYTYEIAEQKGVETTVIARESGFPLGIKIEEE